VTIRRRNNNTARLLVDNQSVNLVVEQRQVELSLGEVGPQGVPGPPGPPGPAGPPGETQTVSFVYVQAIPSASWEINHNLNWYPNVTVVDSAGTVVEGEIDYESEDRLVLRFSSEFSGKAYLS